MPLTLLLSTSEARSANHVKEARQGGSSGNVSCVRMMFASRPSPTLNIGCMCRPGCSVQHDVDANVHISSCFDIGKPSLLPPPPPKGGHTHFFPLG